MPKKAKRMTKRERKAKDRASAPSQSHSHHHHHIHCIVCGRHMNPEEFEGFLPTGRIITCDHGSQFAACAACELRGRELVAEHDRTGEPVQSAAAWH